MKSVIASLLCLLISIPVSFLYAADFSEARLGYIKGDVQIYTDDANDWIPAAVNTPINEDDRIWVPDGGRAEVQLHGGIYIRLDQNTALDVIALESDDYQFHLEDGRIYINNRLAGIDHIQIDTPFTSISSYDNSIIIIDAKGSGDTELSVIKGYSVVETANGRTRVSAGQSLLLHENTSAEISPLPQPDKWEKWNQRRDRKLASASESLRYLPNELDDSAPDLDKHGTWHFSADFGYVWRPRLALTVSWAPYRDGRWIWKRGSYVWVSYEPWGWSPYHYGRWAYLSGFGWAWVPPLRNEVIWSPGYVAWVESRDTIAWVPLAPGEIYSGYTVHRPGNINVNIGPMPRRQIYKNASVKNSVTIINRDTFITGRKKPVAVKDNPFLHNEASTKAPAIKPARETAVPILKQVPNTKRPPEHITRIEPKAIKRERKIRRDETDNIMRHEKPPGNLPIVNRPEPRNPAPSEKLGTYRNQQEKPVRHDRQERQKRPAATSSEPSRKDRNAVPTAPPATGDKKAPSPVRIEEVRQDKDRGQGKGKDKQILKQYKEGWREGKDKND